MVAYQHAPFPKPWLAPFQSRREIQEGLTPDLLVALGRTWKKALLNHGYPESVLVAGPALRYNCVHETDPFGSDRGSLRSGAQTVLVASSIGYADSFELLVKSIEALKNESGIKVLVKLHPRLGHDEADRLIESVLRCLELDKLPEHVSMTQQPIFELLSDVGLLLHNGTSVALEAMAYGAEQLLVKSDLWFDMTYEGFTDDPQTCVSSPESIRKAALIILNQDDRVASERASNGRAAVRELFLPFMEDNIGVFLPN